MSLFTGCQEELSAFSPEIKSLPEQTLRDVAYGTDSAQRMDIYLPAQRSSISTKAIVVVHGGGWNSGNKSDFISYIDSFMKRMPEYAVFNVNYRLYNGGNLFPAQEEDIRKAISFITSRSNEYHINREKIVMLGASAGAHLALLQAYKYNEPSIAAVIDFFGPTDLTSMYENPWHPFVPHALQMVTGTNPAANPDLYKSSSPINYITSSSAPTLILHGASDPVVHVSQSRALQKKLEQKGVPHELIVYPSQRHGWSGATLSNSFDRIEKFLESNVK